MRSATRVLPFHRITQRCMCFNKHSSAYAPTNTATYMFQQTQQHTQPIHNNTSHYLIEMNGLPPLSLHDRLLERVDVFIQRHPALFEQRSRNHPLRHVQFRLLQSHIAQIRTLCNGLLHKSIVLASFLLSMLHHDSHHSHSWGRLKMGTWS